MRARDWVALIVFTIGVILCCFVAFSPSPVKRHSAGYVYTPPAPNPNLNGPTCSWSEPGFDACIDRKAREAVEAQQRRWREWEQDELNYQLRQRLRDDASKGR